MIFALAAGSLFDIDREGEFEDTLIGKCRSETCDSIGKEHAGSDYDCSSLHRYLRRTLRLTESSAADPRARQADVPAIHQRLGKHISQPHINHYTILTINLAIKVPAFPRALFQP